PLFPYTTLFRSKGHPKSADPRHPARHLRCAATRCRRLVFHSLAASTRSSSRSPRVGSRSAGSERGAAQLRVSGAGGSALARTPRSVNAVVHRTSALLHASTPLELSLFPLRRLRSHQDLATDEVQHQHKRGERNQR